MVPSSRTDNDVNCSLVYVTETFSVDNIGMKHEVLKQNRMHIKC